MQYLYPSTYPSTAAIHETAPIILFHSATSASHFGMQQWFSYTILPVNAYISRTMILSVLSSLALVSGVMVLRSINPVHSVLYFILVFCNTSGLLLLLGLDLFAMIYLVVYIGAIAVLFLFVVMMLNIQIAEIHEKGLRYLPVSGMIGLIFWWEMFLIIENDYIPYTPVESRSLVFDATSALWGVNPTVGNDLGYTVYAVDIPSWTNLETLGNLIYTYYSVWLLVSSIILLVAMIGAIVLTMHRD